MARFCPLGDPFAETSRHIDAVLVFLLVQLQKSGTGSRKPITTAVRCRYFDRSATTWHSCSFWFTLLMTRRRWPHLTGEVSVISPPPAFTRSGSVPSWEGSLSTV